MRLIRIFFRGIKDGFKSVFRNFALSLAAIAAITVTLLVVAVALVLSENINYTAESIADNIELVVFLEKDITVDTKKNVESEINKLKNMEDYKFKSRHEIANEYMQESEVFKAIMSTWGEDGNPLQDTFIVKVIDNKTIGDTADEIMELEGVTAVNYGRGMVEQLLEVFEIVKTSSLIAIVSLVLVAGFLISNTIKITILARKSEIDIMRLVGASNFSIKIPFIFEGLLIGIIGSIVPIATLIYGYNSLYSYDVSVIIPVLKLVKPTDFVYGASLILILIGVVVGVLGSYGAVKKHLKI